MPVQVKNKGDYLKFLRDGPGGGDLQNVSLYLKSDIYQKVTDDTWKLRSLETDEELESVGDPNEFKDFNGEAYENWEEVVDAVFDILVSSAATNAISVNTDTTLTNNNMLVGSINVVYVDSSSAAISLTLDTSISVGTIINVKDENGTSATNNITVSGTGQTIDRVSTLDIIIADSSYTIVKKSSTEWHIISGLI